MEKNSDKLIVLRCQKCKGLFVPPKYTCPNCAVNKFEEVELSGKGKIMTYTTIRVPPLGFENQVPYDLAVIRLPEGIDLTARLVVKENEEPNIGREVFFLRNEAGVYWFGFSA
jgi:uncharacterized OB-fold protein